MGVTLKIAPHIIDVCMALERDLIRRFEPLEIQHNMLTASAIILKRDWFYGRWRNSCNVIVHRFGDRRRCEWMSLDRRRVVFQQIVSRVVKRRNRRGPGGDDDGYWGNP